MSRECYKCGHLIKPIFMKKNICAYNLYQMWKESKSEVCFDCWYKEK